MLLQLLQPLCDKDELAAAALADWLIDNHQYHPELSVYVGKLRSAQPTIQMVIDIGRKFGTRKERKIMAKADAWMLAYIRYGRKHSRGLMDHPILFSGLWGRMLKYFLVSANTGQKVGKRKAYRQLEQPPSY